MNVTIETGPVLRQSGKVRQVSGRISWTRIVDEVVFVRVYSIQHRFMTEKRVSRSVLHRRVESSLSPGRVTRCDPKRSL